MSTSTLDWLNQEVFMLQNNIEEIEDYVCNTMSDFWGDRLGTIVVRESTSVPYNILTMEVSVYEYLIFVVRLEHSSLGFSVKLNGGNFGLLPHRVDINDVDKYLDNIDKEIRLRIPDKYLKAKGWL
jgi:hypothetical protein